MIACRSLGSSLRWGYNFLSAALLKDPAEEERSISLSLAKILFKAGQAFKHKTRWLKDFVK